MRHRVGVGFKVGAEVEREQGRDPLGKAARGNHPHALVAELDDLLGRHDHVPVVGKQQDVVGRDGFDGGENVLGRRIHGLPTADHRVDSEAFQDSPKPVATGDGDERQVLGAGRTADILALQPMVLRRHVVDLEPAERPHAAGVADDGRRFVGVDVDLDRGIVANHQRRFAMAL